MKLAFLKTFVTVAELRHFARAAATCSLSQPAVAITTAMAADSLTAAPLTPLAAVQEEAQAVGSASGTGHSNPAVPPAPQDSSRQTYSDSCRRGYDSR